GIVEVATELADKGALINGPTPETALARALIAAALIGDVELAQQLHGALGDDASRQIADALGELAGRSGRLQLGTASTAIAELARGAALDIDAGRAFKDVWEAAGREAEAMKDEFISTEHFLIALAASKSGAGEALTHAGATKEAILEALVAVRGNQRVQDQDP